MIKMFEKEVKILSPPVNLPVSPLHAADFSMKIAPSDPLLGSGQSHSPV
jgi:hypothetical protein